MQVPGSARWVSRRNRFSIPPKACFTIMCLPTVSAWPPLTSIAATMTLREMPDYRFRFNSMEEKALAVRQQLGE